MICMCVGGISCSDDEDDEDDKSNNLDIETIYANLDGIHLGTYTNEMYNDTYDRQGTSFPGNITIKRQNSGVYTIDLRCDDYGLILRIENVSVSKGPDALYFSISQAERKRLDEEKEEYWTISGNVSSDGEIHAAISGYVYAANLQYTNHRSNNTYHFVGKLNMNNNE